MRPSCEDPEETSCLDMSICKMPETKSNFVVERRGSTSTCTTTTTMEDGSASGRLYGTIKRLSFVDLWENKDENEEPKTMKDPNRRSVSFVDDDVSQVSESTYTLTPTRKKRLWYSDFELEKLQDHVVRLVDGQAEVPEGEDMRGLEVYLDSERTVQSEECTIIMLEHLSSIRKAGMEDSFDMESLGSSLSEDAVRMGDMQAAQDSAEAYVIYLETMEPETVNPCFQ